MAGATFHLPGVKPYRQSSKNDFAPASRTYFSVPTYRTGHTIRRKRRRDGKGPGKGPTSTGGNGYRDLIESR